MSQKISEISALADQRKAIFENSLLNVEDTQKALMTAISSEEQLLFSELNLLASKLDRGGKDICSSCTNLKEMLVGVCGEVSIILQLAKESPSHSLNRYVKISHVVKGTLDPSYRVLVPELQHLSVPYWNLVPETIDDVLNDTNKYTQEHIDHAMKLSDAIIKIASGDISVVENIGPVNFHVYTRNNPENMRSQRAKVHKIFTSKLKMIQHEKLKNVQNPLIVPKSSIKLDPKAKPKSEQSAPKLQEWLGLRDWKNTQAKRRNGVPKEGEFKGFNFGNEFAYRRTKTKKSVFDDPVLFRALTEDNLPEEATEQNIEIFTIGRDKKLESTGRSKEEKLMSEEYYESQVHFTGNLMGVCVYGRNGAQEPSANEEILHRLNIRYCFPFIILYEAKDTDLSSSNSLKKNSSIIDKAHSGLRTEDGNSDFTLPILSPEMEKINVPIVLGKVERPRNALFVADVRQTNIRIQSIHSNSITPETSRFLGAAANLWKPIEDGFEISNVIKGKTVESWLFSCPDFQTAEKWVSMLIGEDSDTKACIHKIGAARLCIKSLSGHRNTVKMSRSKASEIQPGEEDKTGNPMIDVVPKIPDNTREKLLLSTQPDHHILTQTVVYEDEEGEYYEEEEIDFPDVMSARLDRKLTAKETNSLEKLLIPSILKIGKEPVIQIEELQVFGASFDSKNPRQVVLLTKSRLLVISSETFEKHISHDLLLDEYSIPEEHFTEIIPLSESSESKSSNFSIISSQDSYSNGNTNNFDFGFEYHRKPGTSITFVCPTKDSELIWLDTINNSGKRKPLKYWRQILDGLIVRHRRKRSPKSPKASKRSSKGSRSSHSRRKSTNRHVFDDSDKFTDTSIQFDREADLKKSLKEEKKQDLKKSEIYSTSSSGHHHKPSKNESQKLDSNNEASDQTNVTKNTVKFKLPPQADDLSNTDNSGLSRRSVRAT
ncbi:B-box zinc finger family protein [Cryptosporidium felis]|nr:B-box zinc finger family protein [Cryptosporidium felis]